MKNYFIILKESFNVCACLYMFVGSGVDSNLSIKFCEIMVDCLSELTYYRYI